MGKPRKRISGAGSVPTGGFTHYQRAMGIDVDSKYLVVAFADRTAPEINTVEFPNDAYGIRRLVEAAKLFAPCNHRLRKHSQLPHSRIRRPFGSWPFSGCHQPAACKKPSAGGRQER